MNLAVNVGIAHRNAALGGFLADKFVVNQIFQRFAGRLLKRLGILRQLILIVLNDRRHRRVFGVELLKGALDAIDLRDNRLHIIAHARLIRAHGQGNAVDGGDGFILDGNDGAPIADGENDDDERGDDAQDNKEYALLFLVALAHPRLFTRFGLRSLILFCHNSKKRA